jgi:hypothetical protein
MEYATEICEHFKDHNYLRYVGYNDENSSIKQEYFNNITVRTISAKITELLHGVDPENRAIIVPDKTIWSVMSEIYNSYRPPTGDIYSRYIVPSGTMFDSYIQNMIDQVIELITSDVRNNLGIEEHNRQLTVWTTVYGDFNQHGLRQVPPIKIRNKHPAYGQIHMRY